jgi:hypothetical protein
MKREEEIHEASVSREEKIHEASAKGEILE